MAREVVKKVKNAVLYSDGTIRIDKVRLSYPHVGSPYEGENDDGKKTEKFKVTGMLDKKTHVAAKDLCVERIDQILKENKVKKIGSDKKFIRNGDDHENEEYDGQWTVSANESRRPRVRGADGEVLDSREADQVFYGGAYGHILIRPWFQNSPKYGKRVNAGLSAIQFWKDGDAFGEGRISDDEIDDSFEDLTEDGDDGDFPDDDDGGEYDDL